MLTLADVFEALTGIRRESASQNFCEAVIDSRQAKAGSLFVALPGERVDGHLFVGDALRNGSTAALIDRDLPGEQMADLPVLDLRPGALVEDDAIHAEKFCIRVENSLTALQTVAGFYRRKMPARVIGITGSVGKSTTKELTSEVLAEKYRTLKNVGNLNNEIGLPLTLLNLRPEHERAVLEMGFYVPGEIEFLCSLAQPAVGVITNIGTVHAERAGSQEMIARGKAELVQSLPADGVAILNYDDPWVRPMAEKTQARVFYYGLDPAADLWADEVESQGLEGIRFQLHSGSETFHLHIPLIGQHSVHTALRAASVGLAEGLSWGQIIEGLRRPHAQLRLVTVRAKNGALILDDSYNASPESTMAAMNLLRELDGHRVLVLGDMLELGPYERQGHEMVGARAAEVADRLIAVGERARMIARSAMQAGMPAEKISWVADVPDALALLTAELTEQDLVLVKGSHGLRMDRIVAALGGTE